MFIKIGKLSNKTGVHIETIRYYERMKLIPKPARSEAGHRVYDEQHVKRLSFIRRCRELDFSLKEIRFLLQAAENENPSCAEVEKFSGKHLSLIQAKIKDLRAMEKIMKSLLNECQGNRTLGCPLIDVLYEG
ncbi:MAG: helix-turn-helix domain-containing protein [Sphingomonadales bacterium]